jgi:hypothetical protein
MTEKTKTIYQALVAAQRGFAPALKSSSNPHFKSRYADLAACVEAVMDSLNANGIYLMQRTDAGADSVSVETIFVHESGETLTAGALTLPVSKRDAQGFGSALTYCRRYSLMAACGIAPEDDDGNAAVAGGPQPAATITEDQAQELVDLADEVGADAPAFLKYLGVSAISHLPASKYTAAKMALEKKRKKAAKEGAA